MLADVPPTVLVVSETAGFHHDSIPAQQRFLRSLRGLRLVVLQRVAQLTTARLRTARAVVFASTSGSPRFSATGRRAFVRFVRDGGGFVGTHSASATFSGWPDYVRLLGTRFSHHGPVERRRVVVADRAHSVTRGLPAQFSLVDEYYRFVSPPRAHVLLREGPGGPPLAWVRSEGRGRVFYSALGHPMSAWSDPDVRRLVSQGVRWVARLR